MKIAIVGCGMIADAHVKVIRQIENADIVAVCDKEPLMAAQLAERYDIPQHFSDFDELANQCSLDVVHILTPPATHFELGISALEAGCDALVEKPFTTTSEEAVALINKATSLDRRIVVNHFHNFSPPSLRLREMVYRGQLGEIVHIEGFYSYRVKSPVARTLLNDRRSWLQRLPGKLLQNNIDHLLGKFIEFIPDSDPRVWACAKRMSEELRQVHHSHVHDELRVMITGEMISAYATFSSNINPFQHFMNVYGTKGTVFVDYESRTLLVTPASNLPGPFGKLVTPFLVGKRHLLEGTKNIIKFGKSDFHFYAGTNNLFRKFYQCVKEKTEPPIPYKDIITVTSIMEQIFRQVNDEDRLQLAMQNQ